jgi:hypothetical protein
LSSGSIEKKGMQIGAKVLKICSSFFITHNYDFLFFKTDPEKHKSNETPLHNPLYGPQHFVWNCQGREPYKESSLYPQRVSLQVS